MDDNTLKEEIRKQWNNNPCGQVGDITYDLTYFKNVEDNRYTEYGEWMKETYDYQNPDQKGKRLLEVGFGQGTDLVQYAMSGAEVYGIDYTPKHYELAKLNFELRGLTANLNLGDASDLPFESNYFDKVVSFGVLHHTPDIQACIDEIHRVLKPGGQLVLSLYYKNSFFYYYVKLFLDGILKLKLFTLGYHGLMSTVETGADGKKIKPLVNVYSKKELNKILKDFTIVKTRIRHLKKYHIPFFLRSEGMLEKLSRKYGWYIIVTAQKN